MTISDIFIRLLLASIISGIIGYEREKTGSNAGLRTHVLVGIGATTLALIQISIIYFTIETNQEQILQGAQMGVIRSDPARLIAQVISGIGFLGAGTIIVTKRNVFGLTTAASIWNVAAIGIALGMGLYIVSIFAFLFTSVTLIVLKNVSHKISKDRIIIKYIKSDLTFPKIEEIFSNLGYQTNNLKYSVSLLGNEYVYTHLIEIQNSNIFEFSVLITNLSRLENIISVERTNIE